MGSFDSIATAALAQAGVAEVAQGINTVWILVAAFMVFLMQPGFALLEAGQVRRKNTANVLMKNLMDWSLGVLGYFVAGFGVALLVGALTSTGAYSVAEVTAYLSAPGEWINWLHGAVFAMAAATIVSGAIAGRMKFSAYVFYAVAVVVVIYPVTQGIVWNGGLLSETGYLGAAVGTGYIDFAGGTVVHMVGGVAGLTAAYLVGPRTDRYDEDGNSTPIPGHSVFLALLGSLILAFGWYGFNVGTQTAVLTEEGAFMGEALGRIVLVTTLGMGAGSVGAALVTTVLRGTPDPVYTGNGLLAGLVSVTAGAVHLTWWGAVLLGLVAGALLMPIQRVVTERAKVDDVCGVFAVHGASGALGAIAVPFLAVGPGGSWAVMEPTQWAMQGIGVAVIALWTVTATVATLGISDVLFGNRVSEEDEDRGLDRSEHNISAYPEFVADGGSVRRRSGDAHSPSPGDSDEGSGNDGPRPSGAGPTAGADGGESMVWRGQEVGTDEPTAETALPLDGFEAPALVVDSDGQIAGSNVAAQDAVGYHEPPCGLGTLPEAPEAFLDRLRNLLETPEPSLHDRTASFEAGERFDQWSVVPLVDLDSGDDRYLVVGREPSELRAYRERLRAAHQDALESFASGSLDVGEPVPEPPLEAPEFRSLRSEYAGLRDALGDAAAAVESIIVELPDQSEELLSAAESITDVSDSVTETAAGTSDLAGEVSADLSTLSSETRATAERVADQSATLEEVNARVSAVADRSETAATETDSAADGIGTAVEEIADATELVESTAAEMRRLDEKMDDVEKLVDAVESISEETNILALNASIEAARSDAAGDGFAVVADEVKHLAEDAKRRTDEIETIVGTVVEQTSTVRAAVEESTETLRESTETLQASRADIDRANAEVNDATAAVDEVASAVEAQVEGAEAVAETMAELRSLSERIDERMDEIDAEAGSQAETMDELRTTAASVRSLAADVDAAVTRFDRESGSTAFSD